MTDDGPISRIEAALAAGEFDYGQVCCGDGVWGGHPDEPPECCGQPLTLADDIRALLDRLKAAERRDALRYRWLRAQHWDTGALAVVVDPKRAVKLGHDLPSLDRLDAAIDDAMRKEGGE